MTIFNPKIILQHLVNSQNTLRPSLRQNVMITFEMSLRTMLWHYITIIINYDAFDMSYGINSLQKIQNTKFVVYKQYA